MIENTFYFFSTIIVRIEYGTFDFKSMSIIAELTSFWESF